LGVFDLKMKIRAVQPQMVNFSEISAHLNSCVRKYLRMYTLAWVRVHTYIQRIYTYSLFINGTRLVETLLLRLMESVCDQPKKFTWIYFLCMCQWTNKISYVYALCVIKEFVLRPIKADVHMYI